MVLPHTVGIFVGVPILIVGSIKDRDYILGNQSGCRVGCIDVDKLDEVGNRGSVERCQLHLMESWWGWLGEWLREW